MLSGRSRLAMEAISLAPWDNSCSRSWGMQGMPSFTCKSGMMAERLALPQRSPKPSRVPWTWLAPASTPTTLLATAMPQSSWKWTATGRSKRPATSVTIWDTSWGKAPPLVSHRQSTSAPPRAAASRARRAKSRSSFQPSKKCSPSKMTSLPRSFKKRQLSSIIRKFSS